LGYLLSKPDKWEVRVADLVKQGSSGEYKIRAMLDNARDLGYMVRVRITEGKGVFTWKTFVYESPSINPFGIRKDIVKISRDDFDLVLLTGDYSRIKTSLRFPTSGSPTSGSPTCGKPQSILNTKESSTNDDYDGQPAREYIEQLTQRVTILTDFYIDNISPKIAPLMKQIIRNTAIDHENAGDYQKAFEAFVKNGAGSWDYLVSILDNQKNGKNKKTAKQETPAPSRADEAQEARARIQQARAQKSQES
jgi:hypothetical protein